MTIWFCKICLKDFDAYALDKYGKCGGCRMADGCAHKAAQYLDTKDGETWYRCYECEEAFMVPQDCGCGG